MSFRNYINSKGKDYESQIISKLYEDCPQSILVINSNYEIEYFNKTFSKESGYDISNSSKLNIHDIELEPLNGCFEEVEQYVFANSRWKGQIEYSTINNKRQIYESSICSIKNDEGQIQYFILMMLVLLTDNEKYFNESKDENRYRTILENVNEYIYSVDFENGKPIRTFHSPRCYDIVGYTSTELESSQSLWYDMIHKEDKEKVVSFLHNLNLQGGKSNVEHRIVTKNGDVKWVSNYCTVTKDNNGVTISLDGFIQDVTLSKKTTEKLRLLSRAVEQSPASVVITDVEGNIEYVNPKFTHLTGYSYNEVIGQNPRILKSGRQNKDFYRNLWETIISGEEWIGEFNNRKKDGTLYWEWASISPIRTPDGEISKFLAVKEDITILKTTEEQLRKREAELQERNDSFERELYYAQQVQRALLPMFPPKMDLCEIKYIFKPLDAVGGDFFSFFEDSGSFSMFVGDVVGHGVAAALFLALLKYITESISVVYKSETDKFLTELSGILYQAMVNHFITAVYAYFEKKDDKIIMHYSNGGHPPAIIYRSDTKIAEVVEAKGTILGMFDNIIYKKKEIVLHKGDCVFFYTDGLPETADMEGNVIGYDSLPKIIEKSYSNKLYDTLQNINANIEGFRGEAPPEDDLLVIGVCIK